MKLTAADAAFLGVCLVAWPVFALYLKLSESCCCARLR